MSAGAGEGGREVLDLFSAAAGGWSLGMHRAGYVTIAACEVEDWRRAIYSENNPDAKVYDDVRTLTADRLLRDLGRLPSIVVGSPPCQDISSANTKGRGVEGERSGLYFEAVRIIGEVRPRWFALENSANLRTRGYDSVKAALEANGYACWPLVVRAGDIGANHDRARAWVLGCDLVQVAGTDGIGRDEGWSRGRGGFDAPVSSHPLDPARVGHEGGRTWRYGPHGNGAASVAGGDGNAGYADRQPSAAWLGSTQAERSDDLCAGRFRSGAEHGGGSAFSSAAGNPPDADQARQVHGCMEPGLRQAEIANDGRGAGRCDNGPGAGQVGLCASDSGHAVGGGADWSLADLADHLRLDDGLSARLAGTRVAVGDGKGQSASSLVVEAFGDAVIPQIPEAIGRAFLRVERAMAAIHGRIAA